YDGRADQCTFDEWKHNVETWAEVNRLPRKVVMSSFPQFITGYAKTCFDLYVLPSLFSKKWEPKEVFEILQEHCFPLDYKMRVHTQLVLAKQGNLRVIDFVSEIVRLAEHVLYPVNEEFLVSILWTGLNGHIRTGLVLRGIMPGT
ncbi:hypothetical protein BDM02DRAFT_3078062, partial [Thelephora ganbajun]